MQLTSKEKSWTLRQQGDPRHMRMVVWVDRGSLSVVALRRRKAEQSPGAGGHRASAVSGSAGDPGSLIGGNAPQRGGFSPKVVIEHDTNFRCLRRLRNVRFANVNSLLLISILLPST